MPATTLHVGGEHAVRHWKSHKGVPKLFFFGLAFDLPSLYKLAGFFLMLLDFRPVVVKSYSHCALIDVIWPLLDGRNAVPSVCGPETRSLALWKWRLSLDTGRSATGDVSTVVSHP